MKIRSEVPDDKKNIEPDFSGLMMLRLLIAALINSDVFMKEANKIFRQHVDCGRRE